MTILHQKLEINMILYISVYYDKKIYTSQSLKSDPIGI